ncbi:MAG: DUF5667 domain-containing protein [Anaerolineaceae bacterium]|nr:DUF5667 domain-containing protein [Anaerolineaceae bacterium]
MKIFDEEIKQKLEKLDAIPERNPLRVQSAKKNFMNEARMLAGGSFVSVPKKSWWNQIFVKKETFPMKLLTITTILALLFGGGISAVAAQDSLPGDLFYPVKTLVEDIELGLATKPETQFQIALKHANYRFDEINTLVGKGEYIPEPHIIAWQTQLMTALQFGVNTEDPIGKLLMVQNMLQQQTMMMNKGELTGEPIMNMFKNTLQNQMKLVTAGIEEPELLSNELKFMANYQEKHGTEELEELWMNMYMYGNSEESEVGSVQNQGEVPHPVEDPFMWMHLNGSLLSEIEPGGLDQGGINGGYQNSFNDQPNGGNQGDNDNGNNGGSGSNGGGNGGK